MFADAIRIKILRWVDYPGLFQWTINAITVLIREKQMEIMQTEEEEAGWLWKQRLQSCSQQTREAGRMESSLELL